ASSPFDDSDADIILRSSDNVDFRVHKLILKLHSAFFKTMFGLPQPPPVSQVLTLDRSTSRAIPSDHKDGLPLLRVTETSSCLHKLLRFCYSHLDEPELQTLEDIRIVLDAALKYEMDTISKRMRHRLVDIRYLKSNPIGVFAIGCHYRLRHEAITAARYTLRYPMLQSPTKELGFITGLEFFHLLTYHKKCGELASGIAFSPNLDWLPANQASYVWFNCRSSTCYSTKPIRWRGQNEHPTSWWTAYMDKVGQELRERPFGDVVTDPEILEPFLARAIKCPTCQSDVIADLSRFSKVLVGKIESEISKV
ncbi:hypothetical protein JAAARDRAFT_101434, partial [Jaapia argillacea MUCL 33604]